MEEQLIIYSASREDIDKLIECIEADPSLSVPPNKPMADFKQTFDCPAAKILLIKRNNLPIGTVTASWNGRHGEMRYLWIDPLIRKTELSRRIRHMLVNSAFEYLRENNIHRVIAFVKPENIGLVKLYESEHGAQAIDVTMMVTTI